MTPKRKRLWLLVGSLGVLGVAAALVLTALNDSLVFFYSPTQVAEKHVAPDRRFRLGGLVEAGSVKKDGQEVRFTVTDTHKTCRSSIAACCPIFSARARAWWPRARWRRRRLHAPRGAGQARRELHAAGSRQGDQGERGNGAANDAQHHLLLCGALQAVLRQSYLF